MPQDVPPSPYFAGLRMRCPACGKGRLFKGYLKIADRCAVCGEDFTDLEQGDGPAVFASMIVGFLAVGLALYVEVRFMPPLWVHAAIWLPFVLLATLAVLPPLKGILAGAHYRHRKGHEESG